MTAHRRIARATWLAYVVGGALFAALFFFARASIAAPSGFAVERAPAWVDRIEPGSGAAAPGTVSNGCELVLLDKQTRVGQPGVDEYTHVARRIVTQAGLDTASQVSIEFDGSYQKLAIHAVVVRRDGKVLDRLDPSAVKIAQREPDLEQQMYDGRRSALLFVDDLRVGDVVEYAYTLHGADPTLGGKYGDTFLLGAPEPIAELHLSVLMPAGRGLNFRMHEPDNGDGPDPVFRNVPYGTQYVWDLRSVPAYTIEDHLPDWYTPLPWVEVTELERWGEVADWGRELFRVPRLQGEAARVVDGWRHDAASRDAFLLRAVRFVQDEVRYVGIEVGMGRRRPADPNRVFERRHGDCKDKAALLVAILERGGIEAQPALVAVGASATIMGRLPTPAAFDHAIVRVGAWNERPFWVDATASLQGGGLEALRTSDHGWALVLGETFSDLTALPEPPNDELGVSIRERFVLPPTDADREGELQVERTYRAGNADSMRGVLERESQEERKKTYLDLYARRFPGLRELDPVAFTDDRDENVIVVHARYAVPKPWSWDASTSRYEVQSAPSLLEELLVEPASTARKAPLAFPHPVHARQEITLALPVEMTLSPMRDTITSPVFRLAFASRYADRAVTYTYELESTGDAVWPPVLAQHATAVHDAHALMERTLWTAKPIEQGPSWPGVLVLLFAVPVAIWVAWKASRFDPSARPRAPVTEGPRGIRGMLLFVSLRVVLTPFAILGYSASYFRWVLLHREWSTLATSADADQRALAYICLLELAGNVLLVAYAIACAILFFGKKRSFPWHFTVFTGLLVALRAADHIAVGAFSTPKPGSDEKLFFEILFAGAFVLYVWASRRVARTFVEPVARRAPEPPPAESAPGAIAGS